MSTPPHYASMTPAQIPAVARLLHHAFAGSVEHCERWLRDADLANQRVLADAGRPDHPPACLTRLPMGQHFGGVSVPMLGIAGVAVAPEARGGGLARMLMSEMLREARREDWALSTLYPSTQALYRSVGYEQAGHRCRVTLEPHRIAERGWTRDPEVRSLTVRPLTPEDELAVRACYARFASAHHGTLDRGAYCWNRTRINRDSAYRGFGFFAPGGGLEGYTFLIQVRDPTTGRHDITLSDLAFVSGRAGRATAAFFADFATTADHVTLHGGPLHPLLMLLPQQRYKVEKVDYWMLRIVDVRAALERRGYPAGISASVTFEVRDDIVPDNTGLWRLTVDGGRGEVSRAAGAGEGATMLRLGIAALAPLYSGLASASQLALLGLVDGELSALRTADTIFGFSSSPWMIDMF